jgi:hypothetical protein
VVYLSNVFQHNFAFGGKILRVSQKDSDTATKKRAHTRGFSVSGYAASPHAAAGHGQNNFGQMSPSVYQTQNIMSPGHQYGPPFNPFPFQSPGSQLFQDATGQYYTAIQSPYSHYGFPSMPSTPTSPSYTTAPPPPAASGSPMTYPSGYGYYGPQYATNPYSPMGMPAPSYGHYQHAEQTTTFNNPGATANGDTVNEDRSATPTPTSHGVSNVSQS